MLLISWLGLCRTLFTLDLLLGIMSSWSHTVNGPKRDATLRYTPATGHGRTRAMPGGQR